MQNYALVSQGFGYLTEVLAPYVAQQLQVHYGQDWWQQGVLGKLYDEQKRDLPVTGDWATLTDSLDAARCLILLDVHWNEIFRLKLSKEHRNWIKELITTRNKWAHKGSGDMTPEDAWRALDTMARLLEQLDSENTEKIRALARQVRYGTTGASTEKQAVPPVATVQAVTQPAPYSNVYSRPGLTPWRYVIEPHPDVAQGRYRQAEFAADLAQVARGTAQPEYQDPVEFFGRTYITAGMKGLLVEATRRIRDGRGEPVIQLKTAFGGGKTHSMLALYHLLRKQVPLEKLPHVRDVLAAEGITDFPPARVAVLVGTALNPSKVRRPPTFPGTTIRTLWGELAAQLAEQSRNPEVYDLVKEADRTGVAPGSDTLRELLDMCGPCVVLIDEIVAYARKIYGVPGLPSGSFESVLTFVQELTEAARASKSSLVVASIPESDIEVGGEAGKIALETIEHTFGRMESIWKPVGAEEGFDIVRRRLFLPVHDQAAMEETCRAFSEMYRNGGDDFPAECKELAYLERLKSCYPIHPEVFDRLYNDWATMEHFQKTRGVLRFMAMVIHNLWINQDTSPLIMPGSIPLDNPGVREELTRYLSEGWSAVVETDVDGQRSEPCRLDAQNARFGRVMAARRVARTIFLGSAPSVKEQSVRGIEAVRIRLGVVQPGEQIAIFSDALSQMQERLTYLFSSNRRYWYDSRPNLLRTVQDRAQGIHREEVLVEMERRLSAVRERADFVNVHVCPAPLENVPDEPAVRLVVLGPMYWHRLNAEDSPALQAVHHILENRMGGPRLHRNMLAFVAPDREIVASLETEVRKYLAWKSVYADKKALNLDAHDQEVAEKSIESTSQTVDLRLREAYCWLLVPTQEGTNPVEWTATRLSGNRENHVVAAARFMTSHDQLIIKWAPALLRMEMDERGLWQGKDYVQIKQLWGYFTNYCYLPRLRNADVLLAAIREGLATDEFFGYATGVRKDGSYMELTLGQSRTVTPDGFLVRPEKARQQIEADVEKAQQAEQEKLAAHTGAVAVPSSGGTLRVPVGVTGDIGDEAAGLLVVRAAPPAPARLRRFFGSKRLDPRRAERDFATLVAEVLQHLTSLPDGEVQITVDIAATVPGGVPEAVVRTVTENCKVLRFDDYGFEEN